ncbi:MAG: hypothetical protein KAG61_05970 [Bacteriovoracaceae bacterium]|nr:hypothetical protein [Bacteriovoracaceae bacterium]
MRASIDIGSNSILLLVGNFVGGKFEIASKKANVTGLGRGIDKTKEFCDEAMQQSFEVLKSYCTVMKHYGVEPKDAIVTATEASRVVANSRLFFGKIKRELDLNIQIITGEGEAHFTSLGVVAGSTETDFVIMDIGGASTEFMRVEGDELVSSVSLPVGCVRMTEWKSDGNAESKLVEIKKQFDLAPYLGDKLVCEAGTMTSLGAIYLKLEEYTDEAVQGLQIPIDKFTAFTGMLSKMSPEELLECYPFLGKRAQVIPAGAELALIMCKMLKVKSIEVSTYGLRYGTLKEGMIPEGYLA